MQEESAIQTLQVERQKKSEQMQTLQMDRSGILQSQEKEQQKFNARQAKTIQMMLGKKDRAFVLDSRRHILQVWHEFARKRKQALLILERAMNKSLQAEGLKRIKMKSKKERESTRVEQIVKQFFSKYSKSKMREAMTRWRGQCYKVVFQTDVELAGTIQVLSESRQD